MSVGRERTAEILTSLCMLLCNKVLFGRKYGALHFYKAELERELARLMNGYTVISRLTSDPTNEFFG